jgi:hypothetical protein
MRWPLRRRPQGSVPGDSHGSRAEAAAPQPRRDWATLPPIEPAVGPAPLVAQRRALHPGLPGAPALETALAPLGHHLSADAPGGTVAGLAVPVAAAPTGQLPPLRGMERHRQIEPAGVGEMPDLEPVRMLREADPPPSPPETAPSLTQSPDPYSHASPPRHDTGANAQAGAVSPLTPTATAGAAAMIAQRVTVAGPMQRSQLPGSAEGPAGIPQPRPSLGRSRRLGIGIPFSRTPQPGGAVAPAGAAGAGAPLPSPGSPGGASSSAAVAVSASPDSTATVDPPATSTSPSPALPTAPSFTAATPEAAGTRAVHSSTAALPASARTVLSAEQAVSIPSVQRAASVPVPSTPPPVAPSSLVPTGREVSSPRRPVLPDQTRPPDATSSDGPASAVQREPAMSVDPPAPWRGPLADVVATPRHQLAAGPSAAAANQGPAITRELPAPMRPPSRDTSTADAAPEGDPAVVLRATPPVAGVETPSADPAEVRPEPPATIAVELPRPPLIGLHRATAPPSSPAPITAAPTALPSTVQRTAAPASAPTPASITAAPTSPPVTLQRTTAPASTPTPAPVTAAPASLPVTLQRTAAPASAPTPAPVTAAPASLPVAHQRMAAPASASTPAAPVTAAPASLPVALQRAAAPASTPSPPQAAAWLPDLPAPSPPAITDQHGVAAAHRPATPPVTPPTNRPTVAHARLTSTAPLVQALRSLPPAALPSATAEWAPTAAAPASTASGPERPGWQPSPTTGDAPSGRGLPSLASLQRDVVLRPGPAPAVDLPLPLRATAAGSSEPRADRVVTLALQRAIEEPAHAVPPVTAVQQQAAEPAAPAEAGPSGPGGPPPGGEIEELARRLYEHIGTRLRAELLVERERAGMVTDLR